MSQKQKFLKMNSSQRALCPVTRFTFIDLLSINQILVVPIIRNYIRLTNIDQRDNSMNSQPNAKTLPVQHEELNHLNSLIVHTFSKQLHWSASKNDKYMAWYETDEG